MKRAILCGVAAFMACDEAQTVMIPAATHGRALASDPTFSPSEFNVFACTTCHTTTPLDDGGVASTLYGAVDRERWWGGAIDGFIDAVDFCYVYFMRGFPSLDPRDEDTRALYEWLATLSDGVPRPARPLTIVEATYDPSETLVGDPEAGRVVFDRSCRGCHGSPRTGEGRLGPNVSIVPDASVDFARDNNVPLRLVLAEKVRHGQFFGVGGNMPFWPLERMSDQALADLLEYLDP